MKKQTVVVGVGNVLMCDEGIGPTVVQRLGRSGEQYPGVDFADVGTGGLSVLHQLEGRRRAVLVDCANMGEAPGTIRRFTPAEVTSVKISTGSSSHEADLLKLIQMATDLGQCPEEVVIFGIEPDKVEPGRQLSDTLARRVDAYAERVAGELRGD